MLTHFRRPSDPPTSVRTALIVPANAYPELARWIWSHPYVAAEVMRRVLRKACVDGTLDAVLMELVHEEKPDA